MDHLKYPIGKFQKPEQITADHIDGYLHEIESLPQKLRHSVQDLMEIQLETPYRPGGWTVRQVVHHLPDSHLNSFMRFKLALTEERPTIRPYDEQAWAQLADSEAPVDISLDLLEALHMRWIILLRSLNSEDLAKTFVHPADQKAYRLDEAMGLYAWHGNHHLAHIETLKERLGW